VLNANLFNTMSEAQEAADVWLTDYNEYRPHESLRRATGHVQTQGVSTGNLYF